MLSQSGQENRKLIDVLVKMYEIKTTRQLIQIENEVFEKIAVLKHLFLKSQEVWFNLVAGVPKHN